MASVSEPAYWRQRYQAGQTGWDLGRVTPALPYAVEKSLFPPPPASLVVPGCGFGHDVLFLAQQGYQVWAVDFAIEPLSFLAIQAEKHGLKNRVHTIQADIFEFFPPAEVEGVWEYTCYCAIEPQRRAAYWRQVAQWLKPGGAFVGLLFPLSGAPLEGPPFLVAREEAILLAQEVGLSLVMEESNPPSHPARAGRETLLVLRRT